MSNNKIEIEGGTVTESTSKNKRKLELAIKILLFSLLSFVITNYFILNWYTLQIFEEIFNSEQMSLCPFKITLLFSALKTSSFQINILLLLLLLLVILHIKQE